MGKNYQYQSNIFITDTEIVVRSQIGVNEVPAVITRGGSEITDFKDACEAHRQIAMSLDPTSTSPPCSVGTRSRWIRSQASADIGGLATNITVPPGNSGNLVLQLDPIGGTAKYSIAGGSFTTFVDGAVITLTDGQGLNFSATGLAAQEIMSGSVVDEDTGTQLDIISLQNSTPAP